MFTILYLFEYIIKIAKSNSEFHFSLLLTKNLRIQLRFIYHILTLDRFDILLFLILLFLVYGVFDGLIIYIIEARLKFIQKLELRITHPAFKFFGYDSGYLYLGSFRLKYSVDALGKHENIVQSILALWVRGLERHQ